MKSLLLLRHAKSDWDNPLLHDFDRPLAARGLRDAPRMGRALKERGPVPELVISSPAVRALQTAGAVIKAAELDLAPQLEGSIYEASSAELMRVIRGIPDSTNCAMLVGHNPGFENTLSRLVESSLQMPTAALACIEFQVDRWGDVEDGGGRLAWFLTPKQLDAGGD